MPNPDPWAERGGRSITLPAIDQNTTHTARTRRSHPTLRRPCLDPVGARGSTVETRACAHAW
eukprot:2942960-Alexandrium_andersonii.AAC.1